MVRSEHPLRGQWPIGTRVLDRYDAPGTIVASFRLKSRDPRWPRHRLHYVVEDDWGLPTICDPMQLERID